MVLGSLIRGFVHYFLLDVWKGRRVSSYVSVRVNYVIISSYQ